MAVIVPPNISNKTKTLGGISRSEPQPDVKDLPKDPGLDAPDRPINVDIETPTFKPVQMPGSGYNGKSKPLPGMANPEPNMIFGNQGREDAAHPEPYMIFGNENEKGMAHPEPNMILGNQSGHGFDSLSLEEKAEMISDLHDQLAAGNFETTVELEHTQQIYDALMRACEGEPKETKSIPYDTYAAYKQEMESVSIPDSAAAAEFAKHTREKYFGEYGDPESVAKTMEQLDKNGQFEGFDDPSNENISRNVDLTFMGGQVVSSPCTERPQFERDIAEPRIDNEAPPHRNNPQVVPQGGGSSGVPQPAPYGAPQGGGSSGVPHSGGPQTVPHVGPQGGSKGGPQPAPYGGPEGGSKSEQPAFVTKFLNKAEAEAPSVNDVAKSGLSIAE